MTSPSHPPRAHRADAERLVRGRGRFVADVLPAGCLHAAFCRSPVARGRLVGIDAAEAAAMPGVVAVLTAADLGRLEGLAVNPVTGAIRGSPRPVIARDSVQWVGEIAAVVIAVTAQAARAAADAVVLDIESLPPVVDPLQALDAPPLADGHADNLLYTCHFRTDDVDAVFDACRHVVSIDMAMPRVAPVPLEPRAACVEPHGGGLRAWLPTQSPHRARTELARLLRVPVEAVQVVAPDVGGAFGGKASPFPEDVLVAAAALHLGRPVRWVATRLEDLVAGSHGRGARLRAALALQDDGIARALRADLVFPVGGWATFSAAVPGWNAARILPGPYRIDAIDVRARGVRVDTAPVGIYRGAGRPEAALVMERLMDAAAAKLGHDPIELRRRNARGPGELPRRLVSGAELDHGDYPALIERAVRAADLPAWRAERQARRLRGERVGIGAALYVEPCGQGWESARVRRDADGDFTVASGSSSQGQDHATLFAAIAADVLGVDPAHIRVVEGDTARAPAGIGALASRSTAIGGSAVAQAAGELRERLRDAAPGAVLEASVVYTAPREAWASGFALARVSIEPGTCTPVIERIVWIDDAGRVVDAPAAHAQLVGGLVQGLGSVLHEAIRYDDDGQLITGTLQDYALPRIDDVRFGLHIESAPTATDANLLGARGVGESGCIVAPAAVLNAVLDALAPDGVDAVALPLTGHRVWTALQAADPKETPR